MIEYLFIVGMIIIVGFLATIIFERTKISTVLILMLVGFLLGLLGFVNATDTSIISQISPFMAVLALIILLFDGGMMLDISTVLKAVPKSTAFTFLVFIATLILVTIFCILLGWDPLQGALMGAIIGGTSSAIVIAMAEKAGITKEARAFLTIESTITDALCIIGAMIFVEMIVSATIVAEDISHMFLAAFLLALFMGAVFAAVWMFIIERLRIDQYYYMLTLAVALILYAVTEWVGASGGFAVFVFGLVLGNAKAIVRLFAANYDLAIDQTTTMKVFQKEITFFVRTFFFVYAGLLLLSASFTFGVVGIAMAITILALLGRGIAGKVIIRNNKEAFTNQDKQIILTTMPRGLAAAVLATTPAVVAVTATDFSPMVFAVIIFSNIIATFGIFFLSGEKPLGPAIVRRVTSTWQKLNAPEDELKKIEKKEKEEEAKEEKIKEETETKEEKLEREVDKKEKELKQLENKIEKIKETKPH